MFFQPAAASIAGASSPKVFGMARKSKRNAFESFESSVCCSIPPTTCGISGSFEKWIGKLWDIKLWYCGRVIAIAKMIEAPKAPSTRCGNTVIPFLLGRLVPERCSIKRLEGVFVTRLSLSHVLTLFLSGFVGKSVWVCRDRFTACYFFLVDCACAWLEIQNKTKRSKKENLCC